MNDRLPGKILSSSPSLQVKPLHIHIHILFILILFLIFLSFNCSTNEPPPDTGALTLVVEDASCIEAWVNLKAENITLPAAVTLKQSENNGEEKVRQIINLTTADTLLYIDSLLPKRSYKFKAEWINNSGKLKTAEAAVVTMDTTSHNFTWQTFTFGQHSSSVLYDVAIINENNIWAVGEIYMNDSLGNPDPACYNAVHWNGQSWELIKTGGYGGYPRRSVFAFSENDVWFDGVIKWDGVKYTVHNNGWPLLPNGDGWIINKMWGSSSNDLYAVGNGGNIAHWDGSSWKKIESGTTTNINDVWGVIDPITQETKIFCAVSFVWTIGDYKILTISGNKIDTLKWNTGRRVHTVWTIDGLKLFVGGGGVFTNKRNPWEEITELPLYYSRSIRGKNLNDIFVVGDFGWRAHFNGVTWTVYEQLSTQPDVLYSIQLSSSLLITVGERGSKSMIVLGRR